MTAYYFGAESLNLGKNAFRTPSSREKQWSYWWLLARFLWKTALCLDTTSPWVSWVKIMDATGKLDHKCHWESDQTRKQPTTIKTGQNRGSNRGTIHDVILPILRGVPFKSVMYCYPRVICIAWNQQKTRGLISEQYMTSYYLSWGLSWTNRSCIVTPSLNHINLSISGANPT